MFVLDIDILCNFTEQVSSSKNGHSHIFIYQALYSFSQDNSNLWQHPSTVVLLLTILQSPYAVLPLFATRFAAWTGGIRVPFMQPGLI